MCFLVIPAEWDFSDTQIMYLEEAHSASHKCGGDGGFEGPGQALAGDNLERWVSVDPGAPPLSLGCVTMREPCSLLRPWCPRQPQWDDNNRTTCCAESMTQGS